jgi:hypothetical protein
MVAAGLPTHQVLSITGYSSTRLLQLKADPAFAQLVAEYREKVTADHIARVDEFAEASISNMLRAERMVEEHLDAAEESDERIPLKTLLALTADRADRFGYGKRSIQRRENVDFAQMMEAIARRSGKSNVIDAPAGAAVECRPLAETVIAPPLAGEEE